MNLKPITLLCAALALGACRANNTDSAATDAATDTTTTAATDAATTETLPLPNVPVTLTDPEARAAYIADHFWDALSFADTLRSHSRDFMETNFANYASVLPYVPREQLTGIAERLVARAEADSAACELLGDIADKYLYDPNSPMLNEQLYAPFLPPLIASSSIDATKKLRLLKQQEAIALNAPGTIANDFSYEGRDGSRTTLRRTKVEVNLLLLFFDPSCEHCREIMASLKSNDALASLVAQGRLSILAVYADGDLDDWPEARASIPQNWSVGLDLTGVQDKGLYVLRAMPAVYLLDADKRVVLKDVHPEQAVGYLMENR
jgi:hypothetical protein